jgi:hypothetical protein
MTRYVLLFLQPKDDQATKFSQWRKEIFSTQLNMSCHLCLDAVDVDPVTPQSLYRHLNVYRVNGLPFLTTSELEEHLQMNYGHSHLLKFHLQLYQSIAELRQSPLPAFTVVTVGITIPTDPSSHRQLDEWSTQEHMPGLAKVPGWQAGIRLQLLQTSNRDIEYAAPYLAIHEWAEQNELGGEVWKKVASTPWSKRVMELQTAPVHRRIWKSA